MIQYRKGDLIKAALNHELHAIAHQCNCFNNMGAGIAPQIAAAFPLARTADNATLRGDRKKLGTYTLAYEHGVTVYNLYGQYRYGRGQHTDYGALQDALLGMRENLASRSISIGFPKIGCGHGGGNWEIVSVMIETIFKDFPNLFVYEL